MTRSMPDTRRDRTLRWLVALAYAVAAAVPAGVLDALPDICPFRRLTGLPCPGCGGTHAFVAMAHGQAAAAWAYNPFGVLAFAAGVAWLAREFLDPGRRWPRMGPRHAAWLSTAVLIAALGFDAWRIHALIG
jgi:hypothetical protein